MRTILAVIGGVVLLLFLLAQCGVPVPGIRPVTAALAPTARPTPGPVAQATQAPPAVGGAPAATAPANVRQVAEAQLVGRPGARFVVDNSPQLTLPVQPGQNCDQIKVGVGNRRTYQVDVGDGISLVVDAVTVNGMFDSSNPGVAWKKGPWTGTLNILDGAICAVPSEWHDWAIQHRTQVLSGIRARYGLSPTPPVRELP